MRPKVRDLVPNFVAIGDTNPPQYSYDGKDWYEGTRATTGGSIYSGAHGNGVFLFMGNTFLRSENGVDFSTFTPVGTGNVGNIILNNVVFWEKLGLFVALRNVTQGAIVITSPDGITWTNRGTITGALASGFVGFFLSGDDTRLYAVSHGGTSPLRIALHRTEDLTTWSTATVNSPGNVSPGLAGPVGPKGVLIINTNASASPTVRLLSTTGTGGFTNISEAFYGGNTRNNIIYLPDKGRAVIGMRGLSAAPGNVFKHSDDGGTNWITDNPSVNYQVSAAMQRMVYSTKAKLLLHATQANPRVT